MAVGTSAPVEVVKIPGAAAATSRAARLTVSPTTVYSTRAWLPSNAAATWPVLGAPAGPATVTIRYANYLGALGGPASRTIDLTVNGRSLGSMGKSGAVVDRTIGLAEE